MDRGSGIGVVLAHIQAAHPLKKDILSAQYGQSNISKGFDIVHADKPAIGIAKHRVVL